MGGFDTPLKRQIWLRDEGHCLRCGSTVWDGDVHHRRARGMGGRDSRVPWINDPAALVLLCRSDHDWLEAEPREARAAGYRLDVGDSPEDVLVWQWDGMWWRLHGGRDGTGLFKDPIAGLLGPAVGVPAQTWAGLSV